MNATALRIALAAAALWLALARPAAAQGFDLPGINADSDAFARELARAHPAGATPAARGRSEAQAAAATLRDDWTTAALALEDRLGQGQTTADLWGRLALAELRRVPASPRHALQAAYQAFLGAEGDEGKAAALGLGAQALAAQDLPAQASALLQSAVALQPDDAALRQRLADANRATGLLVRRVAAEEDADPPRACIVFNLAPTRRADFHPEDWVRLDPQVADAAVTREGERICVSGLPLAATTRALLRAGLPGEGGLSLRSDTTVALTLGNRAPLLAFDSRLFLLPRGQAPRIALTSSNVSSVKVSVALLTERTMLPWARNNSLGKPPFPYVADELADGKQSRVVWSGKADITGFRANALMHTVLPLPADAMREPGLYTVTVRPDDGQAEYGLAAVQPVLQTDLAPTVWRGTDGLTVQVRGYSDALPRARVALRLMAQNNDVLAETATDSDGMARFAAPLLHGEGVMAAAAIQAMLPAAPASGPATGPAAVAADFVSLDLDAAAFDLSDRGVAGTKQPGPLDAFLWTDRGIYRPGETVHLTALLRDNGGSPVTRPAHLRVLRPNGQVFADSVVQDGGGGSLSLPVALSASAAAGIWTAQVLDDPKRPPLGEAQFKVDAFVPDRMAVTIGALPDRLAAGATVPVPIDARFLYGAAAAHLSGSATLRLAVAPQPPAALAGYQVGLADEVFAPQASTIELPPTDDAGHTILPLRLASAPDTTHAVQATLDVEIDDPSGHATHAPATVAVRPDGDLIGIRPLFGNAEAGGAEAGGSVDEGTEAGFDIAAIGPDGARVALPVRVRLVREHPDWRLVHNGGLSSYETVWRDEPLETHELTIPAGAALRFARTLGFGRYRIEVAQKDGLAATSVRFRSGWASSDSPDVPDRADVSADRSAYPPGAVARIHVAAPFPGPATLLVLTDRVVSSRLVDVPAGGADFDVPVDAAWGPGAYVALHVFRGGGRDAGTGGSPNGGTDAATGGATGGATRGATSGAAGGTGAPGARPDRAIGVAWLGLDPAARRLDVAFESPDVVRPRATAHAVLRTAPGAWVSVAAVDEGILRLTGYASPDPGQHFLGRRALGVDIRDDWGRLIAPAQGTATALRQGGDEGATGRPNIPQQIVSLFQPPVQADAAGRVDIALPFPDFDGQVRLMAVAWDGRRLGAASAQMLVRDRLVAEPLLPRFLAPGDTARLAVLLHNLELPEGAVTVRIATDGPLTVQGEPTLSATLAPGAQAVPTLLLHAGDAGIGHVTLDVAGPDGFAVRHAVALDVHSARPQGGAILAASLAPGDTQPLAPPFATFIPGTWRASASFGGPVRYDAGAMVRALDTYPLFCLEQATSKGLPLAMLPDGAVAGPDRALRLQHMVDAVLDRERFDGGFGLWSATDEAEPWLSSYATEFLLRAQRAGAGIGEAGLADALRFQAEQLRNASSTPEGLATQAYALYVLALAGQPRAGAGRVLFEAIDTLPTPLARAQLAAALALGNDPPRAAQAFAAALDAPARKFWLFDYGDALRDQAATALLLKESGLLPDRLASLLTRMPGADTAPASLDTQQQAWLAAAAGVLGRAGDVARISVDDRALPPAPVVTLVLHGAARARNTGDRPVWQSVSITGVPVQPPAAARSAMRISRRFLNPDGSVLDLAHLRQNAVFVLLLEGAAEDAQSHTAQLLQGLPAGWEIAGRLAAGEAAGMAWLGALSETTATPAADDRFQAVLALTPYEPAFRVAVRLRAVTPGNYELPGAEVSDMVRPGVFARQGDNRIEILPAP